MEELVADLVVVGSGPSGQKAAIQSAKLGKKVIVVDRDAHVGGACLNSGTIPSKSLREAILDMIGFYERSFYGQEALAQEEISITRLNHRLQQVLETERAMILRQFRRNNIKLVRGTARFENRHQMIVVDEEYRLCHQIQADKVVIAGGSRPRNPIGVPFDGEVIFDSSQLLKIDRVPKSMLVLGGGIIGSEYASFFAALGTQVTVVDKRDHMLPMLDSEIGLHLQTALSEIGLKFYGQKKLVEIRRANDKAIVTFEDGSTMEAEVLLYALGRQANVEALHIDNVGIQVDAKGYIPVNALFQTEVPNIYAVGDVIGGPSLGSTSMEQGRLAARHAFGVTTHHFPELWPMGIYTIPEISACGYTEEELKRLGFKYEVGRAYYYEIARSHIAGSRIGMFKLLFHAETLEILGVHVIGRGATEVIHIGQVAMSFNAKVTYFIDQIFNYPTYAEGYRVAALNGYNKIAHK